MAIITGLFGFAAFSSTRRPAHWLRHSSQPINPVFERDIIALTMHSFEAELKKTSFAYATPIQVTNGPKHLSSPLRQLLFYPDRLWLGSGVGHIPYSSSLSSKMSNGLASEV